MRARVAWVDDAEDVARDVLLRAYHRLDRFRGDAPFRSWLLAIAHNHGADGGHQAAERGAGGLAGRSWI